MLIFALPLLAVDPTSNWGTAIQALQPPTTTWESATVCGIRALFVDSTNHGWFGGCVGIWYASMTCIDTNPATARDRSCYTDASAGMVTLGSTSCTPKLSPRQFKEYSGTVYTVFGNPCSNTVGGTYFGYWNGSTWVTGANIYLTNSSMMSQLAIDASGNLYGGDSGGHVVRSTDQGATGTIVTGFTELGYSGGQIFHIDVWKAQDGNQYLYFSGEGPEVEVPLSNFSSKCGVLSGDNGSTSESRTNTPDSCTQINTHQYALNGRCSNSNGTASTAYTKLIVCIADQSTTGAYLQVYDTSTHLWTRPAATSIPSPGTGTTSNYLYFRIEKGYTSNEFYIPTGNANQSNLILGSVDGGSTWSSVGGSIAACNNNACRFALIGVSPVDDSKIVASNGNSTFVPNLYYHGSPGPLTPAGGSVSGGAASWGGKAVRQ